MDSEKINMICRKCGTENTSDAVYCENCGWHLKEVDTQTNNKHLLRWIDKEINIYILSCLIFFVSSFVFIYFYNIHSTLTLPKAPIINILYSVLFGTIGLVPGYFYKLIFKTKGIRFWKALYISIVFLTFSIIGGRIYGLFSAKKYNSNIKSKVFISNSSIIKRDYNMVKYMFNNIGAGTTYLNINNGILTNEKYKNYEIEIPNNDHQSHYYVDNLTTVKFLKETFWNEKRLMFGYDKKSNIYLIENSIILEFNRDKKKNVYLSRYNNIVNRVIFKRNFGEISFINDIKECEIKLGEDERNYYAMIVIFKLPLQCTYLCIIEPSGKLIYYELLEGIREISKYVDTQTKKEYLIVGDESESKYVYYVE
ncbi:MAG: zinc ribbon domain-containing protein [Elusimicrobia bacterium]|nr:zinc ribbon domain-containing protein [Elusimicrobiota bacterium]